MGHRQFCIPPFPECNYYQVWSHQIPDPCVHAENASVGLVSNYGTVNGVISRTCVNSGLQLHSSSSTISPDYGAASGTSSQSFMPVLSASSSTQFPPNHTHHQNSLRNGFISGDGRAMANMDNSRPGFKRKTPDLPMMFDEVNTSGFHSGERFFGLDYHIGGSSSRSFVSSDGATSNSMVAPQTRPWYSTNSVPDYRNNCPSIAGEGFQQNVRSRLTHALHHEVNLARNNCPSVAGEGFQRNVRSRRTHPLHPEVIPARVNPLSTPWSSCPTMTVSVHSITGQSSQMPESMTSRRMIFSSGIGIANSTVGINVPYQIATQSANQSVMVRNPCGPFVQHTEADCSSYDPRVSYRPSSSSYDPRVSSTEERGHSVMEPLGPSQHCQPLSIGGHSNERFAMVRNFHDGYQTFADDGNAHHIWVSEARGVVFMDHFYEPWSLLDQHRDMRLDVDNMSYEELLALEETIGNVSTGLSEETIWKCLTERTYNSRDCIEDDHKEEKCAICLEEYKDCDNLGRLNCHHEFHVNCIKKWLQIKNACPICKASAVTDAQKEKQKIHY